MTQLTQLLQTVTSTNKTTNTQIKNKIRGILQSINPTSSKDKVRHPLETYVLKTTLCKKALLYIKDHVKWEKGDVECKDCVKELDVGPLTNVFELALSSNGSEEMDGFVAELLVEAAVSLKALGDGNEAEAFRKVLFCRAQRLFDPVR